MTPGYYWVDLQDGEGPRIVELKAVQGDPRFDIEDYTAVLFTGTDSDADLSDYDSTPGVVWCGPLEPPDELLPAPPPCCNIERAQGLVQHEKHCPQFPNLRLTFELPPVDPELRALENVLHRIACYRCSLIEGRLMNPIIHEAGERCPRET